MHPWTRELHRMYERAGRAEAERVRAARIEARRQHRALDREARLENNLYGIERRLRDLSRMTPYRIEKYGRHRWERESRTALRRHRLFTEALNNLRKGE